MVSKVLIALCVVVTVAVALPGPAGGAGANPWIPPWVAAAGPPAGPGAGAGANPWIPPWISAAPWYPQWSPCTTIGATCLDCNTKMVCTKMGGLQKACTDPTMPFCNLGECSATPTAGCSIPAANA